MAATEGNGGFRVDRKIPVSVIVTALVLLVTAVGWAYTLNTKACTLEDRMERVEEVVQAVTEMKTDLKWIKRELERK